MNVKLAREILDLPEKYNEKVLKQKYKNLAMRYHPDKNPDKPERFIEINEAYQFLLNKKPEPEIENVINSIFKQFTGSFKINRPVPRRVNNLTLNLSGSEYFLGTTRSVPIKENCKCIPQTCNVCGGSGFNLNLIEKFKPMGVCMECLGDGNLQNCGVCKNGTIQKNVNLTIRPFTPLELFEPLIGLINLTLTLPYFIL
jgi:DnaJ-class molecular chaperone